MPADTAWIAAGVSFLAGILVLAIVTAIVVLIDIRVELKQTSRRQRRGRPEPDEFSAGVTWDSSRKRRPGPDDA